MYKICVYAICKNELKFVDKWLNSMQEADYICVLDTGSTDGTYEKLQQDPRITVVKQEIINPWRFDTARNKSMELVPEDADILVCTDLDEVFTPNWATIVKSNWDTTVQRLTYHYAWSHNDLGEPADSFFYDKIHNRDFHWHYPVHEVLVPNDPERSYTMRELGNEIWLHHYPDMDKSRSFYMDLLKIGIEENPDDPHINMLYARELVFQNKKEEALQQYLKCLDMPRINETEFNLVLLESLGRIGDLYWQLNDLLKAQEYYQKFILLNKTYREPYFCLGEIYIKQGLYVLAEAVIKAGLEVSTHKYDWVERRNSWLAGGEYLLSVACFYNGKLEEAIHYSTIAIDHNPNDTNMLLNHISYLQIQNTKLKAAIENRTLDNTMNGLISGNNDSIQAILNN